jgi:hypothetical protein
MVEQAGASARGADARCWRPGLSPGLLAPSVAAGSRKLNSRGFRAAFRLRWCGRSRRLSGLPWPAQTPGVTGPATGAGATGMVNQRPGHEDACPWAILHAIADLRGSAADGYTEYDVASALGRVSDASGVRLACVWARRRPPGLRRRLSRVACLQGLKVSTAVNWAESFLATRMRRVAAEKPARSGRPPGRSPGGQPSRRPARPRASGRGGAAVPGPARWRR